MDLTRWDQQWRAARSPGGWTVPDALLAGAFSIVLLIEVLSNPEMTPHIPMAVGVVAIAVPLAWRHRSAAGVAIAVCVAHLVVNTIASGPFPPQLAILPVLVSIYTAASLTRGRLAVVTAVSTALLTVAAWVITDEGHPDDFWPWMLWAGAWAAGTFVRRRGDLAAHHAARAAHLEAEARTAAVVSANAERDRIAREMHDVIAHSVSVMVVQAGAERLRLGPTAGRTGEALEAIEESGRTALGELRAMLGVLRDGSDEPLAPAASLEVLPRLLDRVREAGLPLAVTYQPVNLLDDDRIQSPGIGVAAYRIVQEALTNVMRHQGLVETRLDLDIAAECLSITVVSDAVELTHDAETAAGRGLRGMRERAVALGGTLEAGARDGRYVVHARLPLGVAAPA